MNIETSNYLFIQTCEIVAISIIARLAPIPLRGPARLGPAQVVTKMHLRFF